MVETPESFRRAFRSGADDVVKQYLTKLNDCDSADAFIRFMKTVENSFYLTLPAERQAEVFHKLVEKLAEILKDFLPKRHSKKSERERPDDPSHGGDKFEGVMRSLPFFVDGQSGRRIDALERVPLTEREKVYDLIHKAWVEVWPVSSLVLPNEFVLWLSGALLGAETDEKELAVKRAEAKERIFERWVRLLEPQVAAPGITDFVLRLQLVPFRFWHWPEVKADEDRRIRVWRHSHALWKSVRPHHTGLLDLPYWSDWAVTNSKDIGELPQRSDVRVSKQFEAFYRSRSGLIWA